MATFEVRALYNFESQTPGELSVYEDEILTVVNADVGEGWWEGSNSKGQTGLFPSAYCEKLSSHPPAMPPPPLPAGYDPKQSDGQPLSSSYPNTPQYGGGGGGGGGEWDDEWDDDDDDDASTIDHNNANNQNSRASNSHAGLAVPNLAIRSSSTGDVSSLGKGDAAGKSTVRRNFNRFSTFVKSGGEEYILGKSRHMVDQQEVVVIVLADDGVVFWNPSNKSAACSITSPKKETKLKGLKSFIAYQIASDNGLVSRRYKHFDWLHQRLRDKYTLVPIPPLPDKQIAGRYEEQFIEHRRIMLQNWVDRISRHPVLSQSYIWEGFLRCTDEKEWKQFKRRSEKDPLVGAQFFHAINPPSQNKDLPTGDRQIDVFGKFVKNMDDSVKGLQNVVIDQIKKHTGSYKRECQRIGNAFQTLATSFEMDSNTFNSSQDLIRAIKNTGDTYNEIGQLYEDQPKNDFEPLSDMLHEYKGVLAEFPDIIAFYKDSVHKSKEIGKMASNNTEIETRMSTITYASLAEINHFKGEIMVDYNKMMQEFITGQIGFYQNVVQKLQDSLNNYQ